MKTAANRHPPLPICLFAIILIARGLQAQNTGAILEDRTIYDGLPEARFSTGALPSSKDLSTSFPTPGDQGQLGSCTAWACAYALKTHQEQVERRWGVGSLNRIFSPSFIYNQINQGLDGGSRIFDALQLMQAQGVALWSDFPYDDSDFSTQPDGRTVSRAFPYRIAKFYKIDSSDMRNATLLKEKIVLGYPLIASVNVDQSFKSYSGGVFEVPMGDFDEKHGRHAVCIVGYDDATTSFRLINSWGAGWGEDGYMRIRYRTLADRLNEVYFAVDRIGEDPLTIDANSPWLFDSDKRRIPPNQLGYLSVETLWRARNEIFARRGYLFTTEKGREYARMLGGHYVGRFNHDQTEARFNEFEHYNLAQIIAIEYGRGDRIGALPPNRWVFSDSNIRRLTVAEVSSKSQENLWKARNEIFARRGFRFQTPRGIAFGRSLGPLYAPVSGDMDQIYNTFNAVEKYNVDLIRRFENPGAQAAIQNEPARPAGGDGLWVFPDSHLRYLRADEVANLDKETLWRARNEIFARRGHTFTSDKGKALARRLGASYQARAGDVTKSFNAYETKNVALIQRYE